MSPKFCLRAGALISQFLECCFLRTQKSLPRNCSQQNEAVCLAYDSSWDSLHSVTGPDREKKVAHALEGGQAHPSSMIWLKPLLTLHHSSTFPLSDLSPLTSSQSENIPHKLPIHKSPFKSLFPTGPYLRCSLTRNNSKYMSQLL